MKTKAVRLYGKNDLRLEEFELPSIKHNEMLVKVISDSICMSTYKASIQGKDHKRVPENIAEHPVIIGHEFCGEVVEVADNLKDLAKPGDKFTIQPALFYKGSLAAPGYSYEYFGGDATYMILPSEVFETNNFLRYESDSFYFGSLSESMSCIVGGFHVNYHSKMGSYKHEMGIVEGGKMAILAGAGPMGLGAIDYALHCDRRPSLLVITDIDAARLARANEVYPEEYARSIGVDLHYVNMSEHDEKYLMDLAGEGGYNDVYVFAPVKAVVEMADRMLGIDGCLNFFSGPTDPNFKAEFNFYNAHYTQTHIAGNTGGNTDDLKEALYMMTGGKVNPSAMITHIGGLDSVVETTLNLPKIPGGKKLMYVQISLPLVALDDFEKLGQEDPMFAKLHELVKKHNGMWNGEAEKFLLANAKSI